MRGSFSAPGVSGPSSGSVVRPPARGGDARRNWLAVAQLSGRLSGLVGGLQTVDDRVSAMKRGGLVLADLHPFKIYNLPSVLRTTPAPETDWLLFRVRAGRVMSTNALNTDGADSDPDVEDFPDVTDVEVPSGTASFWFWLEINGTVPTVRWGPTPTASSFSGTPAWTSTNPWTSFPTVDSAHVPIGWVDSQTDAANKVAHVRQILRTDLLQLATVGSAVTTYRFKSMGDDVINCKLWDGTNELGSLVEVNKPWKLRFTVTAETVDTVPITYDAHSAANQTRDAHVGVDSETQVIVPRYLVNDIVYAVDDPLDPGVKIDINIDGRAWAKKYVA